MTWSSILQEDYKTKKRNQGLDPWTEWDKPNIKLPSQTRLEQLQDKHI